MGRLSAIQCYSFALSGKTGEGFRLGSQFSFHNFKPFLNTLLTLFFFVGNNLSNIGGFH